MVAYDSTGHQQGAPHRRPNHVTQPDATVSSFPVPESTPRRESRQFEDWRVGIGCAEINFAVGQ